MSKSEGVVKYPSTEESIFVINTKHKPFINVAVGETLPTPYYSIDRGTSGKATIIEYVIDGEGEVFIDGEWQSAKKGDTYILLAGEMQKYRSISNKPWHKIWVNYQSEYLATFLESYQVKSGIYRTNTLGYFQTILQLAKSQFNDLETNVSIADCVHKIISMIALSGQYRDESFELKERLDSCVYSRIDLDLIASEYNMSKSKLIRIFKKNFDVTPYEYLLQIKMETAKTLLSNTDLKIKTIAERLYIIDEHYFSLMFGKRVGMTPKEYRENERNIRQNSKSDKGGNSPADGN